MKNEEVIKCLSYKYPQYDIIMIDYLEDITIYRNEKYFHINILKYKIPREKFVEVITKKIESIKDMARHYNITYSDVDFKIIIKFYENDADMVGLNIGILK